MNNREIFASNLNKFMKMMGKTKMDVATDLGIPFSTLSSWANCHKYPRIENLDQLAKYFGVEITDLVSENGGTTQPQVSRINVYSRIFWDGENEMTKELPQYEEIPTRMAKTGNFYALRLDDDSMTPTLNQGDILICKKTTDAMNGKLMIVIIENDDAICSKIIKNEFGITLQAFNPSHESLFFSYKQMDQIPVRMLAEVVESRRKF